MKKRSWTNQQKMQIVLEGLKGQLPVAELCNKYELSQSQYYKWRDLLLEGADALGVLFSLVLTAQHHGLDPYAYLLYVFRSLARNRSLDTIDALLPWNVASDSLG